jgi:gliding motility-associated protein GldM
MAGGKETPRQKMIGMMYLVLTALLALNVSKEILNAFIIVNTGLEKTNANFTNKNEVTYSAFDKAMLNDEKKVRKYYDKAQAVKKLAKEMNDYIEDLKKELLKKVDGVDTISNLMYLNSKDNYDIPTNIMIGPSGDPENADGKARDLKEKIKKYRESLLSYVDAKDRDKMKIGLTTEKVYSFAEEKEVSWENNAFYHNPVAAVITILSKLQNDVKNAEADVIGNLYKQIDVGSFKFDTLSARIVAQSNYVLIGDEYKSEIFVAAFSTTSNPQVWLGEVDTAKNEIKGPIDSTSVKVDRGVGTFIMKPTSEGEQKLGGLIRVKNPADNSWVSYPFKTTWMAARPAAVVSPTKMNVFYIGVDNPVDISVPGVPAENLSPSMSGGTISGSRGKYIVRVTKGPKVTVNVGAKIGGTNKSMGSAEFRVKTVPSPTTNFGGKRASDPTNGISKAALGGAQGVIAELIDFDFDLKFIVLSFDVTMLIGGSEITKPSNGNMLSMDQKSLLSKAKTGSKVYIENVKVKGPDGTVRSISGLTLKVL